MSTPGMDRFEDLLSRYLDATLQREEEQELLGYLDDGDLAARFREATRLDTEIAGLLAGSVPDPVMAQLVVDDLAKGGDALQPLIGSGDLKHRTGEPGALRTRGRRWASPVALVSMLVALAAVSALLFFREAPVASPVAVESVTGEVYFDDGAGRTRITGERPLTGGTITTVGPASRAILETKDGSLIQLMGDTSFTAEEKEGKRRMNVGYGVIRCSINKQPSGSPMAFSSREATITVRGTELAISVDKQERKTLLVVTKGTVAIARTPDGPTVMIETGHYCRVEESGAYHSFPLSRLPRKDQELIFER